MKKILAIFSVFSYYFAFATPVFATDVNICPSSGFAQKLCEFAQKDTAFGSLVGWGITTLLVLSVIIALFFLVWGGIKWIISGGDKTAVESARNTVIAAIVGLIIAFLAFLVLNIIGTMFGLPSLFKLTIPSIV